MFPPISSRKDEESAVPFTKTTEEKEEEKCQALGRLFFLGSCLLESLGLDLFVVCG